MYDWIVAFYDAGNCNLASYRVDALTFNGAYIKAFNLFYDNSGINAKLVAKVEIEKVQ